MTKGQLALVIARANVIEGVFNLNTDDDDQATPEQKTRAELARPLGISRASMARASTILAFAPELVGSVIAGAEPFDGPGLPDGRGDDRDQHHKRERAPEIPDDDDGEGGREHAGLSLKRRLGRAPQHRQDRRLPGTGVVDRVRGMCA